METLSYSCTSDNQYADLERAQLGEATKVHSKGGALQTDHPFRDEGEGEDTGSTAPQGAGLQRHLAEHRERGEVGG